MQEDSNSLSRGGNGATAESFSDNIINLLPGTFCIISTSGEILKWNKKLTDVFGYSDEEIAAMGPLDFFAEEAHANITQKIEEAFTNGHAEVEEHIVTKSGAKPYYLYTADAVMYNNQPCLSVIGVDITEKILAQKELKEREEQYNFALQAIGAGVWSFSDFHLQLLDISPRYMQLLGRQYENRKYHFNEIESWIHPEDFKALNDGFNNALANQIADYSAEARYIMSDGELRWFLFSGKLSYAANGQPVRAIGSIIDIHQRKVAEAKLKENKGQLRLFIEHSPVALAMLDNDMRYLAVSNRWKSDYNLGEEDILGKSHYDVFPELPGHWRNVHKRCLAGTSEKQEEEAFVREDGTLDWLRWEIRPWHKATGEVGGIIIFTELITEQKETELKFRTLVEKALVGVYIIQDGKLVYVNPKYAEIFGYSPEELIGKYAVDLVYHKDRHIAAEKIKDREDGLITSVHYEVRCVKKSGGIFYVEAFGNTTQYKGKRAILGNLIDISDRKKSAEALQLSLKELSDYKIALDESSIVAITDQKGTINYVNDNFCKISKYSRSELIGQDHRIINSGYHSKEFIKNIWVTIANGKIWRGDLCNKAKDGTIYWVETTIVPFLTDKGKPWQYVAIRSDITNRKNAEEQRENITADLLQRNKDLEQFTYIVSHNLRAPVANIIGFSTELKDPSVSDAEKQMYIKELSQSVNRLDTVIKDLNDILQIKQNVSEVKEVVVFSKLLRLVKAGISSTIKANGVVINANFDEVDKINTLSSYMHSIFQNLITNSIKYRNPSIAPVIDITSHKTAKGIVLEFQDNGLGIDLEKQGGNVFGLYKRFHPHNAEGKGIGLFMVKTQVEALGGNISVLSIINVGTKFIIEFAN